MDPKICVRVDGKLVPLESLTEIDVARIKKNIARITENTIKQQILLLARESSVEKTHLEKVKNM